MTNHGVVVNWSMCANRCLQKHSVSIHSRRRGAENPRSSRVAMKIFVVLRRAHNEIKDEHVGEEQMRRISEGGGGARTPAACLRWKEALLPFRQRIVTREVTAGSQHSVENTEAVWTGQRQSDGRQSDGNQPDLLVERWNLMTCQQPTCGNAVSIFPEYSSRAKHKHRI